MAYEIDSEGTRWAKRPSNLVPAGLLQDAPAPRELSEVRPTITPWGNAMRLEIDHQAWLDQVTGDALRAVLA